MAALAGVMQMKLPVRDVRASLDWYRRVFAVEPVLEFPDADGVVRGIACTVPGCGDTGLALRENPKAQAMEGLEIGFYVEDEAALREWAAHLDALGVARSPVVDATVGWLIALNDLDGHEIHLYTKARHGLDQTGRRGYGRPTATG